MSNDYNVEDFEAVSAELGVSAEGLMVLAKKLDISIEELVNATADHVELVDGLRALCAEENDMDDSYAGGEMGMSMPPDPGMAYAPVCGHRGIPTRVECAMRFVELMIRPAAIMVDPSMSLGGNNQRELRDEEKPAYKAALEVMQLYLKGDNDYAEPPAQPLQPSFMHGIPSQMPPVTPTHSHGKQVAPETGESSVGQVGQPPVSEESGEPGSTD